MKQLPAVVTPEPRATGSSPTDLIDFICHWTSTPLGLLMLINASRTCSSDYLHIRSWTRTSSVTQTHGVLVAQLQPVRLVSIEERNWILCTRLSSPVNQHFIRKLSGSVPTRPDPSPLAGGCGPSGPKPLPSGTVYSPLQLGSLAGPGSLSLQLMDHLSSFIKNSFV